MNHSSLPWNRTTPIGYLVYGCSFVAVIEGYFLANGALLILFVSICVHHEAFYEQFQYVIGKLDKDDAKRNNERVLCDLIRFHNITKG